MLRVRLLHPLPLFFTFDQAAGADVATDIARASIILLDESHADDVIRAWGKDKEIVRSDWVRQCVSMGRLVPPSQYCVEISEVTAVSVHQSAVVGKR